MENFIFCVVRTLLILEILTLLPLRNITVAIHQIRVMIQYRYKSDINPE